MVGRGDGGEALVPDGGKPTFARLPRIIWMLWYDGWDQAPELHKRCQESWQLFNIGWEVRALSRNDIPEALGGFMPEYERLRLAMNVLEKFGGFWIPPAAESDLLRLALLYMHGGVWADSTMLCRRPLDDWLPEAAGSGFFAYAPENLKEKLPVMSSFMASAPEHPITEAWFAAVRAHWAKKSDTRKDLGFFWVHHLFGQVVGDPLSVSETTSVSRSSASSTGPKTQLRALSPAAQRAWALVPRISGEYGKVGPHFWVPYNQSLRAAPSTKWRNVIEMDRETPMWKLTNHEVKLQEVGPESCYRILLEDTRQAAQRHAAAQGGADLGPTFTMMANMEASVVRKLLTTRGSEVGCHSGKDIPG